MKISQIIRYILNKGFSVNKALNKIAEKINPDLEVKEFKGLGFTSPNNTNVTINPVVKIDRITHDLPAEFKWIDNIGMLPKTMQIILSFCGLLEKKGHDDNPTIIDWAHELRIYDIYNHDSIPWCGLGQAIGVSRAGYKPPKGFLAAKSWVNYGVQIDEKEMSFGDIVVLNRDDNPALGHVARYIGEDKFNVCLYGANQSDSWCFAWFSKNRIFAVRRDPFHIGVPTGVKKYLLKRNGELNLSDV